MKTIKHTTKRTLSVFATACVFGLFAAGTAVAQPALSDSEACQLAVGGGGTGNKVGGNGSGNKVGSTGSGNKVGGTGTGNKVGGTGTGAPDTACQPDWTKGLWNLFG